MNSMKVVLVLVLAAAVTGYFVFLRDTVPHTQTPPPSSQSSSATTKGTVADVLRQRATADVVTAALRLWAPRDELELEQEDLLVWLTAALIDEEQTTQEARDAITAAVNPRMLMYGEDVLVDVLQSATLSTRHTTVLEIAYAASGHVAYADHLCTALLGNSDSSAHLRVQARQTYENMRRLQKEQAAGVSDAKLLKACQLTEDKKQILKEGKQQGQELEQGQGQEATGGEDVLLTHPTRKLWLQHKDDSSQLETSDSSVHAAVFTRSEAEALLRDVPELREGWVLQPLSPK